MTALSSLYPAASGDKDDATIRLRSRLRYPRIRMGIECEVEGVAHNQVGGWRTHTDGSLRNGLEFVFSGPANGVAALNRIARLSDYLDTQSGLDTNERTSTHIHINMIGCDVEEVQALLTLVYVLEPGIFRMTDEGRKWCGYAQPLSDMPVGRLSGLLSDNSSTFCSAVDGDRRNDRYFGLNVRSLREHGTVEFRYFSGYSGRADLEKWAAVCTELVGAARAAGNALAMLSATSGRDALQSFLEANAPTVAQEVLPLVDEATTTRRHGVIRTIREASDIEERSPRRVRMYNLPEGAAALNTLRKLLGVSEGASANMDGIIRRLRQHNLTHEELSDLVAVLRRSGIASEDIIRSISNI